MRRYAITWDRASENAAGSMPFGGHSVGGNAWCEGQAIYCYLAQSGWFDENNSLLKAGRLRLDLDPWPFAGTFSQTLDPETGEITFRGDGGFALTLWAETERPVVHWTLESPVPLQVELQYQSWRDQDRTVDHLSYELFQCKEVFFYPLADAVFHQDTLAPEQDRLWFWHQNDSDDLSFDKEVEDQGLGSWRDRLTNPQQGQIMGGVLDPGGLTYAGSCRGTYQDTTYLAHCYRGTGLQSLTGRMALHAGQYPDAAAWRTAAGALLAPDPEARAKSRAWWQDYWTRSYIHVDPEHPGSEAWRLGRNYQLFRHMLGLNARGLWSTKFNGGLLTFDPRLSGISPWKEEILPYSPDFRLWGGGSHTIQNQRLLYWPMLRAGDFQAMEQHFGFFQRLLPNAEINVAAHLPAQGAMFPEQVGTYGLCCGCDNEWGNRTGLPVSQIKYHFSNSLETALMMLEFAAYTGTSPERFLHFIDEILLFYHTFYPQNDANGHMVIYPANALESYHVVRNPADAIAGLTAVLQRLLALPEEIGTAEERDFWSALLERVPPLPRTVKDGREILAPAETTSLLHNCELPQLYPVHPYGLFGLGQPELELARDTARLGPESEEQLTHISWHPTGVQYARLGMAEEAWDFLRRKLGDGPFRYPAFWGPGHDWTPDHNWGGSGMLQLQEMLLQTPGEALYVLPCWPRDVDVSFRLFAPGNTVVTCDYAGGAIRRLTVEPPSRRRDLRLPPDLEGRPLPDSPDMV